MGTQRTVFSIALVIGGLLLGGSLTGAEGVARTSKPGAALVEVKAKLVKYEEKRPWCTYKPGAAIHGMGKSPWRRFKITSPANHAGRSFGVLLKCTDRKDLLRNLRSGVGRQFALVVPRDFLHGKYSEIEDCSIDSTAMKRWKPVEADSQAR